MNAAASTRAGTAAFVNTTEDRQRLRARLRFGLDAELGYNFSMGMRLATGNLRDPVSTNQTLGNTGARYQVGVDLAWLRWYGQSARRASRWRSPADASPIRSSRRISCTTRISLSRASPLTIGYSFSRDEPFRRHVYLTARRVSDRRKSSSSSDDKWLLGGQLGVDWRFANGTRLRIAGGVLRLPEHHRPAQRARRHACSTTPRRSSCSVATRCSTSATLPIRTNRICSRWRPSTSSST